MRNPTRQYIALLLILVALTWLPFHWNTHSQNVSPCASGEDAVACKVWVTQLS